MQKISALLELFPEYNQRELISLMEYIEVEDYEIISPAFISVKATSDQLKELECLARVEIKKRKEMHSELYPAPFTAGLDFEYP